MANNLKKKEIKDLKTNIHASGKLKISIKTPN